VLTLWADVSPSQRPARSLVIIPFAGVDTLGGRLSLPEAGQLLGHNPSLHRLDSRLLQLMSKISEGLIAVQLAPFGQRACPGKEGGHGIGGGALALQIFIVMTGNSAMGRLVLILPVWRDQHGGHHGQAAKGSADHIAHHISILVLAGPDKTPLGADDPRYRVVNQGIKVGNS